MRLNFDEYGVLLALAGSSRAEDVHTKCAAVGLNKEGRVLGIAYNGLSPGTKMPEWMTLEENRIKKGEFFIHAEKNLCSLVRRGECETICLNLSPCISCCQTIAANSIRRVIYLQEYHRCNKFKEFFEFHGIYYQQLPKGSVEKIRDFMYNQVELLSKLV